MKLNKSKLIQRWKELNLSKYMKDGSFCMTRAGHTRAVAYLEHCHSGVLTARAYAAGTYLGTLSHEEGMDMLKKLESLQCREKDSEMYGCSRWYFEETQIADTNGAFFITMPLLMIVMNLYGIDRETAGQMSRFYCQIAEYADGDWKCLIYPDCCVAILPLGGFGQEGETIPDRSCQVVWDNDTLLVRKKMYQGESVQNLCCERLECGWIVIALENTNGMDDIRRKLDTYCIQDGYEDDYLVPRVFTSKIRRVKVCQNQQLICELVFDLYQGIRA